MVHIIVTGSRTLTDDNAWSAIFARLDTIHRHFIIQSVTQGAAPGADTIAKSWAEMNHISTHDFPADWSMGKKAGPIRNRQMIRDTIRKFGYGPDHPDLNIVVVAFTDKPLKDSKGTKSCVSIALDAGLTVKHYMVMVASDGVNVNGTQLQESIIID